MVRTGFLDGTGLRPANSILPTASMETLPIYDKSFWSSALPDKRVEVGMAEQGLR